MSKEAWKSWTKNRRIEECVRRILDAAFENAVDCEFADHHDFRFWEKMGMRLPAANNGSSHYLDVLLNRLHIEFGIRATMGVDARTIRSWSRTLETFGIVRPVHQGYVIVNRGRLGVLEDYFGPSSDKVDAMCRDGYAKYLEEREKRRKEEAEKEAGHVVAARSE